MSLLIVAIFYIFQEGLFLCIEHVKTEDSGFMLLFFQKLANLVTMCMSDSCRFTKDISHHLDNGPFSKVWHKYFRCRTRIRVLSPHMKAVCVKWGSYIQSMTLWDEITKLILIMLALFLTVFVRLIVWLRSSLMSLIRHLLTFTCTMWYFFNIFWN